MCVFVCVGCRVDKRAGDGGDICKDRMQDDKNRKRSNLVRSCLADIL